MRMLLILPNRRKSRARPFKRIFTTPHRKLSTGSQTANAMVALGLADLTKLAAVDAIAKDIRSRGNL